MGKTMSWSPKITCTPIPPRILLNSLAMLLLLLLMAVMVVVVQPMVIATGINQYSYDKSISILLSKTTKMYLAKQVPPFLCLP